MLTQDQNQTIEAEVVDQDKKQASPNGQHKKENRRYERGKLSVSRTKDDTNSRATWKGDNGKL